MTMTATATIARAAERGTWDAEVTVTIDGATSTGLATVAPRAHDGVWALHGPSIDACLDRELVAILDEDGDVLSHINAAVARLTGPGAC